MFRTLWARAGFCEIRKTQNAKILKTQNKKIAAPGVQNCV